MSIMNRSRNKTIKLPYLTHAHRQHNSIVTTIPKAVCVALGIEAGDIVMFEIYSGKGHAKFKLQLKGAQSYARITERTDREDRGGGA